MVPDVIFPALRELTTLRAVGRKRDGLFPQELSISALAGFIVVRTTSTERRRAAGSAGGEERFRPRRQGRRNAYSSSARPQGRFIGANQKAVQAS